MSVGSTDRQKQNRGGEGLGEPEGKETEQEREFERNVGSREFRGRTGPPLLRLVRLRQL